MEQTKLHKLSPHIQAEFDTIIKDYNNKIDRTKRAKNSKCTINLKEGTIPIYQQPRTVSVWKDEVITEELEKLRKQAILEKAKKGAWTSPVLTVPKEWTENETKNFKETGIRPKPRYRLCGDYREVNAVTIPNPYPLPNIDHLLAKIAQMKPLFFNLIDLTGGFHQLELDEPGKLITGIITMHSHDQYTGYPFGPTNGPAEFQDYLWNLLAYLIKTKYGFNFLDDILAYNSTEEGNLEVLRLLFWILGENNVIVNTDKCFFFAKEVNYLGYTISQTGTKPHPHNLKAIANMTTPTCKRDVQCVLGLIGFYRKYVIFMASETAHMRDMLKKSADTDFYWTEQMDQEFEDLREHLLKEPELAMVNFAKDFILYTDASQYGLGWVLIQEQDKGKPRIIRLGSKSLTACQQKWGATRREYLAIVAALADCNYLIEGHHITVFTDNKALTFSMKKNPSATLSANLIATILEYNLTIKYIPGDRNILADAFSRLVTKLPEEDSIVVLEAATLQVLGITNSSTCNMYPRNTTHPRTTIDVLLCEPMKPEILPYYEPTDHFTNSIMNTPDYITPPEEQEQTENNSDQEQVHFSHATENDMPPERLYPHFKQQIVDTSFFQVMPEGTDPDPTILYTITLIKPFIVYPNSATLLQIMDTTEITVPLRVATTNNTKKISFNPINQEDVLELELLNKNSFDITIVPPHLLFTIFDHSVKIKDSPILTQTITIHNPSLSFKDMDSRLNTR